MNKGKVSPQKPNGDEGFTLIELLIYVVLAVVVLLIVGGVFINSIKVEQKIRRANEGTSTGQLTSQAISKGVRTSSDLNLTEPEAGTLMLSARSIGSSATAEWSCHAWYFGAGEIRTKTSPSLIPAPTAEEAKAWTLLAEGVSLDGSTPVFTLTGTRVDTSFYVSTGDGLPVLIDTTAVSRQRPGTVTERLQCFSP